MNKRLNMMSTLVELINLHMDGYSFPRQQRRPKFSIHGKDQNIKLKIQIHENQVGELVLYDPRTDADYDNPSMAARGHHGPYIRNNNWPEEIKKLSFSRHEEGRDYWAALDIVHLMAMHGFRVQAYGSSRSHLYIGGQLLPNASEQYGRFSFWMDVTTAASYWRNNDPLSEEPVTIPTLPELTEEQRSMERNPRPEFVGKQVDVMALYKQASKDTVDGTNTLVREIATGGYYEGKKIHSPKIDWASMNLPEPEDVAKIMMNPDKPVGFICLVDEDGLPVKDMPEYKHLRSFESGGRTVDYYQQRLVVDDPKVRQQLKEAHDRAMVGIPAGLINPPEASFSIRSITEREHGAVGDVHLAQYLEGKGPTTESVMKAVEATLLMANTMGGIRDAIASGNVELTGDVATQRVSMAAPNLPTTPLSITKEQLALPKDCKCEYCASLSANACVEVDLDAADKALLLESADALLEKIATTEGLSVPNASIALDPLDPGMEFTITVPGGGNYSIIRSKQRPDQILAVGTDPGKQCHYVDPLAFGRMLELPEEVAHIDVRDAAGNVVDVEAIPRRRLHPRDLGSGIISEVTIDSGTDYPELRGMSRSQLDTHFAADGAFEVDFQQSTWTLPTTAQIEEMSAIRKKFLAGDTLPRDPINVTPGLVEHTEYPEMLGMDDDEPGEDTPSKVVVVETPSDAFDRTDLDLSKHEHLPEATKTLLARPTRWTEAVKESQGDIPNDDLYQEANPVNWDVLDSKE